MNAHVSVSTKNDWLAFFVTLVLALPSTVALLCALALSRGIAWYPASAMWFMYMASRYLAYLGIAVCAGTIVGVAIYHAASRKFLALMGLSLAGAVLLLWYAVQIFKTAW